MLLCVIPDGQSEREYRFPVAFFLPLFFLPWGSVALCVLFIVQILYGVHVFFICFFPFAGMALLQHRNITTSLEKSDGKETCSFYLALERSFYAVILS